MTAIKFGVCGIGRIGKQHCQVFTRDPEKYELVALCDIDEERVHAMAEEFGGKPYSDFAEFLADPDMELVIIATRSLDHVPNATQALEAGKTVLLEKPIGVTSEDYTNLQHLVAEYPGKIYFGHNHRFEPAFANAREIVESGLLGNVNVVKLAKHHAFGRRVDWQMRLDCGGGQLSVWGPHLIDQGLQHIGAPIREVSSYLRRILTPGDADDHVRIIMVGENDVVAELELSYSVALESPYCTICGDRGALMYGQDQKEIRLKYLDPEFQWPDTAAHAGTPALSGPTYTAESELPWIEETRPVKPDVSMWEFVEVEMARHLHNTLRGDVPFPVSSEDALGVVGVTEIVKKQNPQFQWIG